MLRLLRFPVLSAALSIACTGALCLACGGGGEDTGAGGGGTAGAGTSVGGTGTGGLGLGGTDPNGNLLTIEPATAMITVTDKAVPATQAFGALLGGKPLADAAWSLEDYAIGNIDTTGLFTTSGIVGGKVKVVA